MLFLYVIFVIVALIAAIILCFYIYGLLYQRWLSANHPDYDRQLTKQENDFISSSRVSLEEFSKTYPFRKTRNKIIYYLGPLFAICLSWLGLFLTFYTVSKHRNSPLLEKLLSGEILYFDKDMIGFSHVIGVFTGILVGGCFLYWATGFSRDFSSWMAVNGSSTNEETPERVLQRRLEGVEHDVRLKRLSAYSTFSPRDYLCSIVARHKKLTGYITAGLLIFNMFFAFFDLRQQAVFYADKLSYTQYWSGQIIDMPYHDLSEVQVSCYFGSKNSIQSKLDYIGDDGASYLLDSWRADLDEVSKIDDALRKNNIKFRGAILYPPKQEPKSGLQRRCVERLLRSRSAREQKLIRKIMHLDDLL